MALFIAAIGQVVGWILVIGGWLFVRRDNNQRESRHELRSALDAAVGAIKTLEAKGYAYYCAAPGGEESALAEVEIKRDLGMLDWRVRRLKKWSLGFYDLAALYEFRHCLTGGDFESSSRKRLSPKDRKLLEISHSATALITGLEDAYDGLYGPPRIDRLGQHAVRSGPPDVPERRQ